jgi:D-lactate dehydrogenase
MKVAVFSTKAYDKTFLSKANQSNRHELVFYEERLTERTVPLTAGFEAVCVFVNDQLNESVQKKLVHNGVGLIALRCAGFNNVDLYSAEKLELTVVRVPAYSPYAVAEHTVGLIMALNRKIHRAYFRVRDGNFSIEGLLGFELHDTTVGIIGTGKIGQAVTKFLAGFGCKIMTNDLEANPSCLAVGARYVSLAELFTHSDIITLHCPLMPETHHLINAEAIRQMKTGVMLINTSRGGLIDTYAVINGLKSGKIGHLGLDVYEEEADLFFENLSDKVIRDDLFARLLTFPNVIITCHQAFFTDTALDNIARTIISNITDFEKGHRSTNQITIKLVTR